MKPPVLKPREVEALLSKLGFAEVRQRSSHRQYRHSDGRATTVPFHQGRDISPALLRQIAKDIGLTVEHLLAAPGESGKAREPQADASVAEKKKSESGGR